MNDQTVKPQPIKQKEDTVYLTISTKLNDITFLVPDVDAATEIIRAITNNSVKCVVGLPYGIENNKELEEQNPFMEAGTGANLTLAINKHDYPPHKHIEK